MAAALFKRLLTLIFDKRASQPWWAMTQPQFIALLYILIVQCVLLLGLMVVQMTYADAAQQGYAYKPFYYGHLAGFDLTNFFRWLLAGIAIYYIIGLHLAVTSRAYSVGKLVLVQGIIIFVFYRLYQLSSLIHSAPSF